MTPAPTPDAATERFARLVEIMRTLRGPDGCPWDREQTLDSLRPFVLEETYEVLDAIERDDLPALCAEIGDLIFEGVFLAQIADERGAFTLADALEAIAGKLVRRHPHVFVSGANDPGGPKDASAVVERWEELKAAERAQAGGPASALAGVPRTLPALLRAYQIGSRAATVGFDWTRAADIVDKIEEEVGELRHAVAQEGAERVEEEFGDLLFAVANLARKLGVEPEAALRRANDTFTRRFAALETRFAKRGRALKDATLEEMEAEWQEIKRGAGA